jgi:hypothetical protein
LTADFPLGIADLVLVLVVTFLAVGTAYLPSPRAKSICFSIPLPFSAALVSSGQPVDATHAMGFLAMWAFVWIAWYLYTRRAWPILLAEAAALLIFCGVSYWVPLYVGQSGPVESMGFWGAWAIMILVSGAMIVLLPARRESNHRSPLPVLLKTLLVLLIVFSVVAAKSHLRGFITAFPYVTCFAIYEGRHSLYTLARRMPTFIVSFLPVLPLCRYLPGQIGLAGALAVSWACFLPLFILMDRFYARRDGAILSGQPAIPIITGHPRYPEAALGKAGCKPGSGRTA